MDAHTFNNYGPRANERWVSRITGIPLNTNDGIDLLDRDKKIDIEVKFALDYSGWTVLDWQLDYDRELTQAYWGLGVYGMAQPVSSVKTTDIDKIDQLITSREIWFVPWAWMVQFPVHKTSGQTKKSKWRLNLAYPKHSKLPEMVKTLEINGAKIYLAKGVNADLIKGRN